MKAKLVTSKNPDKVPKILREKSKKVAKITPEIIDLAEKMIKIMDKNNGIGISAVQVGVPIRMMVIKDCKDNYVLINPEIKSFSRREVVFSEGCLSFPGIFKEISRPEKVKVKAQTLGGEVIDIDAEGLVGRTIEHEVDHLEGIVFLDHVKDVK